MTCWQCIGACWIYFGSVSRISAHCCGESGTVLDRHDMHRGSHVLWGAFHRAFDHRPRGWHGIRRQPAVHCRDLSSRCGPACQASQSKKIEKLHTLCSLDCVLWSSARIKSPAFPVVHFQLEQSMACGAIYATAVIWSPRFHALLQQHAAFHIIFVIVFFLRAHACRYTTRWQAEAILSMPTISGPKHVHVNSRIVHLSRSLQKRPAFMVLVWKWQNSHAVLGHWLQRLHTVKV